MLREGTEYRPPMRAWTATETPQTEKVAPLFAVREGQHAPAEASQNSATAMAPPPELAAAYSFHLEHHHRWSFEALRPPLLPKHRLF